MTPFYVMAASVAPGNRVKQFYGDSPDAARFMLSNAGRLRHAGFDLGMDVLAEVGQDGCWEARSGERKHLRLYQDGTLVFRVAADESFLGWGVEPDFFAAQPRLNPLPVVEVHASFVVFYGGTILRRLEHEPTDVLFHLSLHNTVLDSGNRLFMTKLFQGRPWQVVDQHHYAVQTNPATANCQVSARRVVEAPRIVAHQLVQRFWSLFDMPEDFMPFVKEVDGVKQIDFDQIGSR